jgi:lauroyl/myristoyl acyltransferase
VEVATLILLLPFVLAPPSLERGVARVIAAWQFRPGGWVKASRLRRFPPNLAKRSGLTSDELAKRAEAATLRERVRILRGIVFPWWKRRVSVAGLRHVDAGHAAGNGVILWVHPCAASNVAVKQAMSSAGYALAHLSRPGHPFSARPFGERILNPILRRPEMRFLAERVVIDDANSVAPLRRLRALLRDNRVVSITVTTHASTLEDFDFLGGRLRLPSGPVQLAANSGAPLLPVFTAESGSRTRVELGAPLPVTGRSPAEVRATLEAAAAWLEERVVRDPESWTGWRTPTFQAGPR